MNRFPLRRAALIPILAACLLAAGRPVDAQTVETGRIDARTPEAGVKGPRRTGAAHEARVPTRYSASLAVPTPTGSPELHLLRELTLFGAGGGMFLAGEWVSGEVRAVPVSGLDPSGIRWGVDRRSLNSVDRSRLAPSDWTLGGALILPGLLELGRLLQGSGSGEQFLRSGVIYGEALAVSGGTTWLLKSLLGRPRPYTYQPRGSQVGPAYDPGRERAFRSMPSGHAALAWTGAASAVTAQLLARPEAAAWQNTGLGVLAGGLATATAHFRVQSGQHFPSDVLVGSALGISSGVLIPLLHGDGRPLPTRQAVLEVLGGTVLGSALVLILF